jgi:carotenoid cleavage dioxygenase-like enzyme
MALQDLHAASKEAALVSQRVFGEGLYCSECAFVPKPNAVSEDDGYLLTFITDAKVSIYIQ